MKGKGLRETKMREKMEKIVEERQSNLKTLKYSLENLTEALKMKTTKKTPKSISRNRFDFDLYLNIKP